MILKFIDDFKRLSSWKCVALLLALTYLVTLPLIVMVYLFPALEMGANTSIENKFSPLVTFILVVFIYPILETLVFQLLPIYIFRDGCNLKRRYVSVISAFLFGILHWFSIGYVIYGFLVGMIFSTGYLLLQETTKNPFRIIVIVHALKNLIAWSISYFFLKTHI